MRFPDFEGEWEKCKLGDVCNTSTGNKNTQDKIDDGIYPFYVRSQTVERVNSWTFDGEAILTAGDGVGVGKVFHHTYGKIGVHQRVYILSNFKCDANYLFHFFSSKFYNRVKRMSAKNSVDSVRKEMITDMPLSLPCHKEQVKIGRLLTLLDERIATQNKIIDKLKSLIKGISKQLLMNNQNWRTVRIGELLRIGNGKDYKHLGIGKIPVYGTGGQMLLVNDYLYDGESVCIGRKGTIDTPMFLKGKFWTVDTLFYTYDFKDVLPKFCYYLFLQINWKLYNEGTGVPSLSKSTIENIKVKIPSIEQQHNICSVLDCYEHKTKSEEQILELYLSEKQCLLRQMFILTSGGASIASVFDSILPIG